MPIMSLGSGQIAGGAAEGLRDGLTYPSAASCSCMGSARAGAACRLTGPKVRSLASSLAAAAGCVVKVLELVRVGREFVQLRPWRFDQLEPIVAQTVRSALHPYWSGNIDSA